jgi:hypothetical protein
MHAAACFSATTLLNLAEYQLLVAVAMCSHQSGCSPLAAVQVSTMAYASDVIAAGGFNGELVIYSLADGGKLLFSECITNRYCC